MKRLTYLCLVCTLAISSAAHAATVRTVALSGQQAPGTSSGVNYGGFSTFFSPVLNDAGQTAFQGGLTGSGVDSTTNTGIWSEGSGSVALVARTGDHAPGTPSGVNYGAFNSASSRRSLLLNDTGQAGFGALLTDGSGGIWSEGSGSLALVARTGDHAPGMPSGVNYSGFGLSRFVLNNAGHTAFYGFLTGSGVDDSNNQGIWSEGSGSLALVARSGSQAPGTPNGVNFGGFNTSAVLNDAGQTAFFATLIGSGVDGTNYQGIWSEGSGSLALVARLGSHAPGTPSGVSYSVLGEPGWNNAGQTAFNAVLTGSGVDSTNSDGNWSGGSGSLALVARRGDHAPGTPSGVNYGFLKDHPLLNDAGQTAFFATLIGSGVASANDEGVWSEGSGSLALVAREGDHAPGTPSGVNFALLSGSSNTFQLPDLNELGQSAFIATLGGSGVDSTNNAGIWATDRTGALQLIARIGDLLEVAPGDFRTVSRFGFGPSPTGTGNSDGRPSGFNNLGQLAFQANFTDGSSGVFVSNRVAVPEPSTLLLAALAAAGLLWWRRARSG
jgi:hypothetical protein